MKVFTDPFISRAGRCSHEEMPQPVDEQSQRWSVTRIASSEGPLLENRGTAYPDRFRAWKTTSHHRNEGRFSNSIQRPCPINLWNHRRNRDGVDDILDWTFSTSRDILRGIAFSSFGINFVSNNQVWQVICIHARIYMSSDS